MVIISEKKQDAKFLLYVILTMNFYNIHTKKAKKYGYDYGYFFHNLFFPTILLCIAAKVIFIAMQNMLYIKLFSMTIKF